MRKGEAPGGSPGHRESIHPMTLPWHTTSAGSSQGPGQPVSVKVQVGLLTRLHPYEMFETFQAACGNVSTVVPPKNALLGERPLSPAPSPSREPSPTIPYACSRIHPPAPTSLLGAFAGSPWAPTDPPALGPQLQLCPQTDVAIHHSIPLFADKGSEGGCVCRTR